MAPALERASCAAASAGSASLRPDWVPIVLKISFGKRMRVHTMTVTRSGIGIAIDAESERFGRLRRNHPNGFMLVSREHGGKCHENFADSQIQSVAGCRCDRSCRLRGVACGNSRG